MTSRSASLPARLRRLLASEGATSPGIKVDNECPPKIKALIDKVIQSPLQDIAIPLSGFKWDYNKGNFHHWGPLFLHFETYFKTYLSNRRDLLLSDNIIEDDNPFPKNTVLQILRVMQIILENCPNKSSFSGLEHFKLLLSSTDPEVLLATLETLAALVKINPSKVHGNAKLIGLGSVNNCLMSLAQGWGSKEEGLGLYYCVMENEKSHNEGLCLFPSDTISTDEPTGRLGSTLNFDLHYASSQNNGVSSNVGSSSTTTLIHIPDMHLRKEDDLFLMKQCLEHYNVPDELRFSLLTRIRYTHAFCTPKISRLYSRICLLAFIVLVQSHDARDQLTSFFAHEPDFPNELIRIVRCEEKIPGTIRTLAMQALSVQLASYIASSERGRILGGSSINFSGGNRMIILNVLQKAIMSLSNSNDPSSLAFVEAILQFFLLHVISSSNNGGSIRGSGMVPTFLPLLEDMNPSHMHLVCSVVKTLQKLMDFSHTAVSLFKSLGGVELLAQRLETEVQTVVGVAGADENSMVVGESSTHNADHLYIQKKLIKALLKALGSATYAPSNSSRADNVHDNTVPVTLALIFSNVDKFGGDIYSSAVTLMNEIIHKDPTCFTALHEAGLPQAFLSSVLTGILPSSKALTCVPNGIGAICLNAKGLEALKDSSALRFLVDIFTLKKYVVALNEGILPLANAVEELLRHVSSLRNIGVDVIIEIINKIATFGDDDLTKAFGLPSSSNAMETDIEDKVKEDDGSLVTETNDDAQAISNDQFIQLCIFHIMVLVQRAIENTETCRLFVEKSGIEALLKLLLRPSIAQSSSGMSVAIHSTMVFKGFTQHHSAQLARSFCSALKDQLKKASNRLQSIPGSFLLDPLTASDEVFSSLFIVEFLLFLAASKDNRWVNALLSEFGNGSKDVLVDIGQLHREMLWQIALLEDAKVGAEESESVSAVEEQSSDSISSESERLMSFRQFLDPLLRRRMSGWSAESQFFELMNLYRDLSRASIQQRLGPSNTRSELRNPLQPHVAETSTAVMSNSDEKQSSYYASCCEVVRSLSSHISHLFQELGKAMLSPRRRDDTVNVSPSAKLVVSTFASIVQDHMVFGGHGDTNNAEPSISTKCRYLGKVIDFIDGILLERADSCNPIVLNSLYGQGVLHSVLTTFEATSQLLFAVNRVPTSPMETDDRTSKVDEREEADRSWIHGPLASYGKLMDHLVTSAYILSPSTKHLLCQPATSGDLPFPRDAESFVKVLQAMVLKAVLPVWTHEKFTDCNYGFITNVISIIKHVYSGVEVKIDSELSARLTRPPLNEASILTIVEMGFSRARAEEALRQVPGNSVELAMEWLFSHQEEVQEDDELAHALAMSLGNSETEVKVDASTENSQVVEEEILQLPPVDQLLATCSKLLQMKEALAFPVRDLLVMLCSQNDGNFRSNIITFITDKIKHSSVNSSNDNALLSAHLHVLALIFNEDAPSREVAASNGFIKLTLDLLSQWDSGTCDVEGTHVPKWVTTAFLAIDRLLQVEQKLQGDISEFLNRDDKSKQNSIVIDEASQSKLQSSLRLTTKCIDVSDQKRVIEIACNCMRKHHPSDNLHAVLQLCATLTRTHSVAVSFLEAGGVSLLLSLPMISLFAGFDNIAASIIRHVLEDPQTLQQAMESEIRHSLVSANNRHSSGRISPRNFLMNLTSVISRDPAIFVQAAQAVCQVEMAGERPYIVLIKDREKEKSKEKEKDSALDKEKSKNSDGKVVLGNMGSVGTGNGHGKLPDSGSKNSKVHRKPPQSLTNTIELLLESAASFVPLETTENLSCLAGDALLATDMDVDFTNNKGKGKAGITVEEREAGTREMQAALARTVFILKLLTEVVTMYTPSINVILRRDAEINSYKGSQKVSNGIGGHGILHHILHEFLTSSRHSKKDKKLDGDWRQKLATKSNQFIVACCVRSSEARRRVFLELSFIFNDFVDSCDGPRPPRCDIQAFVDLVNDILAARSLAGSYISAEAATTFIDVGLVKCLTQTLRVLDLDHADSSKIVIGIVKALECVTKEHVNAADVHTSKGENSLKPAENDLPQRTEDSVAVSHPVETLSQPNPDSSTAAHQGPFSSHQIYDGSEAVTGDMEHDQDLDGGFVAGNEDDYMHESSEDARGLENAIDSVEIHFDIQPLVQENLDEDDEDMSGDEEDEVDDDEDEEHNDLDEEEEEVHLMPHPDTDQDDHEVDDDEFDEEVMDEDEDDEDEDDDGVILRLDESINGINVLDHIEVFGRDESFGNDTLQVMPIEVFGSRRQDRTTSIYNLLSRNGDNPAPSRHPLLVEPSPLGSDLSRESDNIPVPLLDSTSHLDAAYRSLRSGRHGQRVNLWADDHQQSGGSNASMVPQGFEELLVSSLKRPSVDEAPDSKTLLASSLNKAEDSQLGNSESHAGETNLDTENANNGSQHAEPSEVVPSTSNVELSVDDESFQPRDDSNIQARSAETQFDHNDSVVRDVEAVSQESSGSGATLGESLRSLDVEIGSADGHDDGGERQASADRTHIGDQISRPRRSSVPVGSSAPANGREVPLHSLTEISEDTSLEDPSASNEQQPGSGDTDTESGSIDPAFLEALPAELRAEVLSAQQNQAPQPSNSEQPNTEEIDPEFLAALPPDIRAEVLAQQQAQRLHQSHELEGQPVEMDTVSIIATFPSDIREEVLLTSSDAILANLTPALVAEANMLRERFSHRYNNRNLFGMYPRSRRGESSRRGEGTAFDRAGGVLALRSSSGGKVIEADGTPLVDPKALESMIRVLRVVQPLYKGPYQRLLLNLCAHSDTRKNLVRLLMNMLTIDIRRPTQAEAYQPLYRLYSGQSHMLYSRTQSSDGIPPLLSRRILEVLTFLARNHPSVAVVMLNMMFPWASAEELGHADSGREKVITINYGNLDNKQPDGYVSIVLLFSLLNQPLYLRSVVHLEHLLHLLEVVIENAEAKSIYEDKTIESTSQQPSTQALLTDTDMNVEPSAGSSMDVSSSTMVDDGRQSLTSNVDSECDYTVVLANLPQAELRLLCSLLAREGLSDSAYALVAEVVKKLAIFAPSHSQLFVTQFADAVQSLSKTAMDELHLYGESEEALLCTSSSNGATVLRVLQALSSLVASLSSKEAGPRRVTGREPVALAKMSDINSALEPLWQELSSCISKIESYPDSTVASSSRRSKSKPSGSTPLPAGSQNLLPYIESFFIMCEKLQYGQSGESSDATNMAASDVDDLNSPASHQKPSSSSKSVEKHVAFVKFTERHRKLLNAFIHQNPGLLEKSFSLMLKVPRFIDFDNKRSHFRSKVKHQHDHHHSSLRISVRRAYILEDSYNQLRMRSSQDLKGRLTVRFQGEEGIDAGGLTREWYQLLSRVIFDKGALLFTTVGNDSTFQPNPNSVYQTEHLSYFKFVGQVVGKALFDGQLLDVHFTRSFYKHILGSKVTYHDIEAIDPDYFKNLKWVLENDISDVLDLTFSIDADEEKLILYERNEVTDYELIPGGRNIKVTEENKHKYVDLIAEHRLTTAIRPQINAFLEGFTELIPRELISIFNDKELELLISGLPDIDLDDMRANTEYSGYSAASPVIQWFWEVAQSFSKEDKARFLQFVTGTSKVPLEGFSALQGVSGSQKFQIHKAYGSVDHLPSAHTCFNQLDLPEYPSKEHLEERLLLAIHEGSEGFGFG